MLSAGRGGVIINNASVSGVRNPNPGLAAVLGVKAAVVSLTRSAAIEYAPLGIRINSVSPGRVETPMMLASGIADRASLRPGCPREGWASPKRSRR